MEILLALFHLAMKGHFFGEIGFESPVPKEITEAPKQATPDQFRGHRVSHRHSMEESREWPPMSSDTSCAL
jgi:hypothetical protein